MAPVYQLEKILGDRASGEAHHHDLPTPHNYAQTYSAILQILRGGIYREIDVGLATLSDPKGIYSLHDGDHFDEVVRKASEIAHFEDSNDDNSLKPYEIFVLLVAIRVHDAGNFSGRHGHERRCEEILSEVASTLLPFSSDEVHVIAEIASAHGGTLPGGDKDKIGALEKKSDVGGVSIRTQRVAALARIADELAENSQRTYSCLLSKGLIPKANEVYHQYAEALKANVVERDSGGVVVRLRFAIRHDIAMKKFGKENKEVYLLDEIRARLNKMNQERVYCNQFLAPTEKITSIVVAIRIAGRDGAADAYSVEIALRDEGYPSKLAPPKALEKLTSKAILPLLKK